MEARKNTLSSIKLCRFCLSQDEPLQSLYDRSKETKNAVPLSLKILSCVSVEVFPSDKMPLYICKRCRFFMDLCYEYKLICRQADETTLQYIQSGTALEPVVWAPSLVKAFRSGAHGITNVGVVKTVVEGGATVEVTAQELSDSDDGEENVYNVKIEDGSDEGSTCVKVVTSKDNEVKSLKKGKGVNKVLISSGADSDDFEISMPSGGNQDKIASGCWACTECNNTFPLQQLLELHKMQKHRVRTVNCDECNAKFFSKYDLMTHQLMHSKETPFRCVACDKTFKRHVLLKRHEKLMHSELPQLSCPSCPATFLSIEELETHQKKHTRIKRFTCGVCDKKYCDNHSLQTHITNVHYTKPELCCEYCPAQFSTIPKLMRHVRSHAGERAYPCKYCDKSFGKSHHYTRHLRMKHGEMIGGNHQVPGNMDKYSCEQCDDTFSSQDDLIYHSAIHATQNLTCPLCQEKFENVDKVTVHIKSHVNGTEFMCDFCELVFTCGEKLDQHLAAAHEDEIGHLPDLGQNESSMEMDAEEFDYENSMNLKEEDDHMVVEIKKPDNFMFSNSREMEKVENTNSEESEVETTTYMELATVDTLAMITRSAPPKPPPEIKPIVAPATLTPQPIIKTEKNNDSSTASILRKAEEVKRKVIQQQPSDTSAQDKKPALKVESSSSGGANDKSLRILEKELQELKRTTTRNDAAKIPPKTSESLRSNRRTQMHTSTPKLRSAEEKRPQASPRTPAIEKKIPERRAVKENKEPKEAKEVKPANIVNKEEKDAKINAKETSVKEEKEKETKENETPKKAVKNGTTEKNNPEEGVRRSTRPSKVKDYAKMIRDRSQIESDEDDSDDDDEEYVEVEKLTDNSRIKTKRGNQTKAPPKNAKPSPAPAASPAPTATPNPRKRGRPRKPVEVPAKVKKDEDGEEENRPEKEAEENKPGKEAEENKPDKEADENDKMKETPTLEQEEKEDTQSKQKFDENSNTDPRKTPTCEQTPAGVLVSPTGQTLKKVPIKALPPGVKPLPLPVSARPMGPGELCEMQIGKKMVKVQKIVMTKAEVEAMAKKGLVEMKDGTMVLKQGIKLPTSDAVTIKSTLVGEEAGKESPTKKDKATPTRCELGDES